MDVKSVALPALGAGGEGMLGPDEVMAMLRLHELGWGSKRIAAELGCARNTVRHYVRQGGWVGYRKPRDRVRSPGLRTGWPRASAGIAAIATWCARSWRPRGASSAACGPCSGRSSPTARNCGPRRATVRFETPPGRQLQVDFGERLVEIGGRRVRIFVFVATLGHSRRIHVRAFRHERQASWLDGLESAFLAFGGVPEEVLLDNARALVTDHDAATRTVVFNARLLAFARHWGCRPRACAPCRARTKGKTESGVGYVKRNAIAGRSFASWEALEAHLAAWERDVANARVHGTTGEVPMIRFERDEAAALRPLADRPAFRACRTLERRVRNDCAVEVDGNAYSVPWRLIGERVEVIVAAGQVRVRHGTREVAVHALAEGRRQRIVDPAHLDGVSGTPGRPARQPIVPPEDPGPPPPQLLRPLAEYEALVGGGF